MTQDKLMTNDFIFMKLQFTAHGQTFHTLVSTATTYYTITLVCGLEI